MSRVKALFFYFVLIPLATYLTIVLLVAWKQRSFIYFPSHETDPRELTPWRVNGETIGYAREVDSPRAVWLMMHGNAGQASQRGYVLRRMPRNESLYVMEYPGYGARPGRPSRQAFDEAASAAYDALRVSHPGVAVCVLGESLGSGPASTLAKKKNPPEKIVLITPFGRLASVASEHLPLIPGGWILRDRWDNFAALSGYAGALEIYGVAEDRVIPYHHAANLAAAFPSAQFRTLAGGHTTWADQPQVKLAR